MSYTRPITESERDFDCAFCGRTKGLHCRRVKDDRVAPYPHTSRINQWYEAGLQSGAIKEFGVRLAAKEG